MSEDCLYLNVYVPSKTPPPGGFPMMIFFYGGGFLMGANIAYMGMFPESVSEDTIIITFNYRVSVMGFLAGDPLKNDSSDGSVGNYGLQDMRQALQFMVQTATAWGGNPERVTIYGESAGGASVSHFLVNPKTWGLYQQAIIESGPFADWIAFNYSYEAAFYTQFATAAGCPITGSASLDCLRQLSWENITDIDMFDFISLHKFGPVVDGVEVLDFPRVLAAAGKIAPGVKVIIGTNQDEGSMFAMLSGSQNMTDTEYQQALINQYGTELGNEVYTNFPSANYGSPWNALVRVMGDNLMTCPSRDTAQWLTSSKRINGSQPVYEYLYVHNNLLLNTMMPFLGVCHASELLNTWYIEPLLLGPGEIELGKLWVKYWTNFAIYGDPNGQDFTPSSPYYWHPYSDNNTLVDNLVIIDTSANGPNITNTQFVRKTECDFWMNHE